MKLLTIWKLCHAFSILFIAESCSTSRLKQNTFSRYTGSSHIDFMQDLTFLDIQKEHFKNSNFEITFCITNPYTCITKFFFISRNNDSKWTGGSYRYRRCADTVLIEKVKINLDRKWDSVFSILMKEDLVNLEDQKEIVKRIRKQNLPFFSATEGDINYAFLFRYGNGINNVEINSIEAYRDFYSRHPVDISGLDKLIRLKYLFSLIFDFDTEFRFEK